MPAQVPTPDELQQVADEAARAHTRLDDLTVPEPIPGPPGPMGPAGPAGVRTARTAPTGSTAATEPTARPEPRATRATPDLPDPPARPDPLAPVPDLVPVSTTPSSSTPTPAPTTPSSTRHGPPHKPATRSARSVSPPELTPSRSRGPRSPGCGSSARTPAGRTPRSPARMASLPQCVVNLNITGSGFWLTGTGTTYDVTVSGICFKSGNVSSFYHHPYSAGTCYAGHFADLAFYGLRHCFGKPGDAFSMTLNTWAGVWTNVAVQDTQYSLRGSDNWLVPDAMNYGWQGNNGGRYLVRFENLSKSTVKHLYLTARGGSRAILCDGPTNQQGGLDISDCVIEGQNLNDPAMGALIVHKGGGASYTNIKLNFGMARPTDFTDQRDTALVMVQGGVCVLDKVWTGKASATHSSVPVVEVTGGVCTVDRVFNVQPFGGTPTVRKVGGTLRQDATVTRRLNPPLQVNGPGLGPPAGLGPGPLLAVRSHDGEQAAARDTDDRGRPTTPGHSSTHPCMTLPRRSAVALPRHEVPARPSPTAGRGTHATSSLRLDVVERRGVDVHLGELGAADRVAIDLAEVLRDGAGRSEVVVGDAPLDLTCHVGVGDHQYDRRHALMAPTRSGSPSVRRRHWRRRAGSSRAIFRRGTRRSSDVHLKVVGLVVLHDPPLRLDLRDVASLGLDLIAFEHILGRHGLTARSNLRCPLSRDARAARVGCADRAERGPRPRRCGRTGTRSASWSECRSCCDRALTQRLRHRRNLNRALHPTEPLTPHQLTLTLVRQRRLNR